MTPPEEGEPETPDPEEPDPAPVYNIAEKDGIYYLFNLTDKKFQIGILNADGACVEYSETVKESFGTGVVPIPIEANPERAEAQDITQSLNVAITYPIDMKKSGAEDTAIEYTVSSIFGDSVNEEFVKQNSKVENVIWSSDSNTLSFTFTPSSLLEHNGLRYSFVPTNLISVETEAVPHPYSVIFKFNGIKASGVFAGGNFYTDVVTQPSLVYNNDLSLAGWTYGNDAGGTSAVTENMRSALALSVSRPVSGVDSAISDAAKAKIANSSDLFLPNAYLANVNYLLDLTLEGRAVTVPDGSYLKLAFPYPEGYGPETSNVAYRVLKFGKNEQGVIDYENCEIIEAIPLRQGIIASVNSFSAFALVAIDSGKIISPYANSSPRTVFTMTSGIGGTVTTNSNNAINTVQKNGDTIVYTFTADEGYEIGFVTLNGEDAKSVNRTSGEGEPATYRFSIAYGELQINNKPAANNVLHVEFVAIAAKDTVELEKTAAKQFVLKQFSGEAYSEAEKNEIVRDYPAGGAIFTPSLPPIVPGPEVFDPSSTQMQLIIVLGVVAAFAVIGAIAIVYCAAIRPKIIREREEEAARIAANRERRANRNRIKPTNNLPPRDPQNPAKR